METIKTRNSLGNVEYVSNNTTLNLHDKFVDFLKEKLINEEGIIFANGDTEGEVDYIREKGKYGYAFACSKFDNGFKTDLPGNQFKYNDDKVKKVLKEAIHKFDMEPLIKWDRGLGVFVYNIFVK